MIFDKNLEKIIVIADWHKKADNPKPFQLDRNKVEVWIEEGRAIKVNENTAKLLYNRKGFKNFIRERDNYICYYCGKYGDTIDHIKPHSKGGQFTPLNCVCACVDCNLARGTMSVEEFRKTIEKKT